MILTSGIQRTLISSLPAIRHNILHLTNTEVIIGGFALVLIIIFVLAAFLDKRWGTAAAHRDFGADEKPNSLKQISKGIDKDGSSKLYTRYADLSARALGTAEQCIAFRVEKHQNLAGD